MIDKPILGEDIYLGPLFADGLVGCWLFNEGSGNKVFDLSGGNTGTFQGTAPSWTSGKFGPAVLLPGTDEYIQILDNPLLDFGTINKTISFRIRKNTAGDRKFIYNQRADSTNFIEIDWEATDTIRLTSEVGGVVKLDISSATTLSANIWYHVVFAVDRNTAANARVFINGVDDTSGVSTTSTDNLSLAANIHLGRWSGGAGFYWNGLIDVPIMYNRILSAFEVALLYQESFWGFKQRNSGIYTRI